MHGQFLIPHVHPRIELPREVLHVYFVSAVRMFLSSSVAIFLPLYYYMQTGSAFFALAFTTVAYVFMGVSLLVLVALVRRASFEWLGLISTVLFVILFAYVYATPVSWATAIVAAIIYGAAGGTYWFPHHLVYSLYGREKTSTAYGGEAVVNSIVTVAAPIISGALTYFFGFHVFFAVASTFAILSLLFWVHHLDKKTMLDFTPMRSFYRSIPWDRATLYYLGGLTTIAIMALPVYLAVTGIRDVTLSVGWIFSLASLFGAVLSYLVGKYLDKEHDYPLGALGIVVVAFLFVNLVAFPRYAPVFLVLRGVFSALSFFPVMGWIYRVASKNSGVEVFMREFILMLGRASFAFILAFFHLSVATVILFGAYVLVAYAIFFYYLSRIRYPEV